MTAIVYRQLTDRKKLSSVANWCNAKIVQLAESDSQGLQLPNGAVAVIGDWIAYDQSDSTFYILLPYEVPESARS